MTSYCDEDDEDVGGDEGDEREAVVEVEAKMERALSGVDGEQEVPSIADACDACAMSAVNACHEEEQQQQEEELVVEADAL